MTNCACPGPGLFEVYIHILYVFGGCHVEARSLFA